MFALIHMSFVFAAGEQRSPYMVYMVCVAEQNACIRSLRERLKSVIAMIRTKIWLPVFVCTRATVRTVCVAEYTFKALSLYNYHKYHLRQVFDASTEIPQIN